MAPQPPRGYRAIGALPLAILFVWILVYPARVFTSHSRFGTNAYDLSVFDYALWSTSEGHFGHVPFLEQSLFSQHFMPTLLVLLPAHHVFPRSQILIGIQLAATFAAAVLLLRLARDHLSPAVAAGLTFAFLFGRRTHSAVTSVFYIESLEPLLVFALLMAWSGKRWIWYSAFLVLLLGCKEDVAIYTAGFGVLLWISGDRRVGAYTLVTSVVWLGVAVLLAIPAWRALDGLSAANPFLEGRLAGDGSGIQVTTLAARVFSGRALERLAVLVASTGAFCLAAPAWFAALLPGLALNLAANPEAVQSGLGGHYLWPVLPWLFWAAVVGAQRVERSRPRLVGAVTAILCIGVIIDTPLWLSMRRGYAVTASTAEQMTLALREIPPTASVLALPNLVPHLEKRHSIRTIGINAPAELSEYIILTEFGDLWPLQKEEVRALVECLRTTEGVEETRKGPVHVFVRRSPSVAQPACDSTSGR